MVQGRRQSQLRFSSIWLVALAAAAIPALLTSTALGKAVKGKRTAAVTRSTKVPLPRPRPGRVTAALVPAPSSRALDLQAAPSRVARPSASTAPARISAGSDDPPLAFSPTRATSPADIAVLKQAIHAARRGRSSEVGALQPQISDPLARKLVEWALLRANDNEAGFARYNAFIAANPSWPSIGKLRRRAEAMLWTEKADLGTVRAFFAKEEPLTAKGRFAYARALLAQGNQAAAQAQVREGWTEAFSRDVENDALEQFRGLITRADDKARMDRRLYEDEYDAAMRAAHRLGGIEPAIVRARNAVHDRARNAEALIGALPASARDDVGLLFSRIRYLRRQTKDEEAARLMLAAPSSLGAGHDTDEWWKERRVLARTLIELRQARAAYLICANAALPANENYRVESEFMAGWIALRFLRDPNTAARHFARIRAFGIENTTALSRAGYWQGRAAEAAGRRQEAHGYYAAAARHATTYYGQLAGARIGMRQIALAPPPAIPAAKRAALSRAETVRAVDLLYEIGERDLVITFVADLERVDDAGALTLIADLARQHGDARAAVLMGKDAVGRGLPLDHHAFPTFGMPRYSPIGPQVEPAIVYAIARQESAFNPRTVSSAKAMGLMQVTPAAGRYLARTYGVKYDQRRLLHDNVYNVQMGAAELGGNIEAYRGSYILAFAAYNAGRGRVKEWIERFGDPRDPQVDPIDWVERIPFSETRNYVQRIMENLQTYRVRFGRGNQLMIEADIRRGSSVN
ncbi:MAG: lytic transglycosylase domain-containing protein [Xanthobacteraceae bacterium]